MSTTLRTTITRILRAGRPASLVTQGRVYCSYSRGDVDVDRCYGCPSYEGAVDDAAGGTWVRCAARPGW